MFAVTLEPASNRATFLREYQALDESGAAIDLTDADIVFEVRPCRGGGTSLSATTDNGKCVVDTTTFTVTFAVSEVRNLCDKQYDVGCTIEIDDVVTQLFIGKLPVVDGVVS